MKKISDIAKISLEGMEFFANHGYYDEEQKIGNKFGVDVSIMVDVYKAEESDSLSQTVNYEKLYTIVKEEMIKPFWLLENIGNRIIQRVFDAFSKVNTVEVTVSKFNPPVGGICKRAKIHLKRER